MGCDIHSFVERNDKNTGWEVVTEAIPTTAYDKEKGRLIRSEPFETRNYGLFGFLADVRNYSYVPPLDEPRGLPIGLSPAVREEYDGWRSDAHSMSWFLLKELLDFDYDATFEDRRCTKQESPGFWNGAADAGEGNGKKTTYREFLGTEYFTVLEALKTIGKPDEVRVVFWFDS